MGGPVLTDELVAAARDGDADALRAMYLALSPQVLGYLRAKGVDDPEAVTSEVFCSLLPRIPQLRGGAAGLKTLTFSIAHARMVDEHRARARRPAGTPYEADADTRVVDSAEDLAQNAIATDRVMEILAVLPPDQREVVVLRVVADLSVEQVATIIGRSAGAVKQLQRRGLVAIRQAITERRVTL